LLCCAISGHGRDDAIQVNLANDIIITVRDIDERLAKLNFIDLLCCGRQSRILFAWFMLRERVGKLARFGVNSPA
jgi:hypothetical protein